VIDYENCVDYSVKLHAHAGLLGSRATIFSAANFAKFRGAICEIPLHYPQIPYISRPVGVVVLTDNTSEYKEFIVTCNMKTLN